MGPKPERRFYFLFQGILFSFRVPVLVYLISVSDWHILQDFHQGPTYVRKLSDQHLLRKVSLWCRWHLTLVSAGPKGLSVTASPLDSRNKYAIIYFRSWSSLRKNKSCLLLPEQTIPDWVIFISDYKIPSLLTRFIASVDSPLVASPPGHRDCMLTKAEVVIGLSSVYQLLKAVWQR